MKVRLSVLALTAALGLMSVGCHVRIGGADGAARYARTNAFCEGNAACLSALEECRYEFDIIESWGDATEGIGVRRPGCAKRLMQVLPKGKPRTSLLDAKSGDNVNADCSSIEGSVWVRSRFRPESGYCLYPYELRSAVKEGTSSVTTPSIWGDWQWWTNLPDAKAVQVEQAALHDAWNANLQDPVKLAAAYNAFIIKVLPFKERVRLVERALYSILSEYYMWGLQIRWKRD